MNSRLARLTLLCLAFYAASLSLRAYGPKETARGDELDGRVIPATVERRKQLLGELSEVAGLQKQAGDTAGLMRTLRRIGEIHLKMSDFDAADQDAKDALSLARGSGNKFFLADALNFYACVYRTRQDNKAAARLLDEAYPLSLRLKYRAGEAQSLTELTAVDLQEAELAKAEAHGQEALEIWRELKDKRGEARALFYLGEAWMRLGKSKESSDALEKASDIWRESDELTELASTLIDLNFLAMRQGQWQKSLGLLKEAQSLISDDAAEPYMAGQIAASFGEVYSTYGQLETSLHYFKDAVTFYRDFAHDLDAAVDVSRKAGRVQARLGQYTEALEQIEQALRLAEKAQDKLEVTFCHEDLGRIHLATGQFALARKEFLITASQYKQAGTRREWARAQTLLGQAEYLQGDLESAASSYRKALKVFESVEDYTNEAALYFGLGRLELDRKNLDEAGKHLEKSIALTEQLREDASSKDLRSSFLASVHDRYETYVEWLMRLHAERPGEHFDVAAFEACEMGRARSLLDSLEDYRQELRRGADPTLLAEEEDLKRRERKALDERAKLVSEGRAPEARAEVERELVEIRARHETLEAQINSAAENGLVQPSPLKYEEIREQIPDADTSLFEYSLSGRKSYVWVITTDGLTSYELPDKETIEKAARKLAALLASPRADAEYETELHAATAEVSGMVLGPVASKLNSKRLVIVSDGILQYVPFQVLTSPSGGDEPLVARHEIVNAPSASTLAVVRREANNRPSGTKLLAAFGDPVFSSNYALRIRTDAARASDALPDGEERASLRGGGEEDSEDILDPNKVQSLRFARRELGELRKLAEGDESVIYSGFDATRDNLRALDLSKYRILHFATHGLLDAKQSESSGLVLSLVDRDGRQIDGFVGLADIYGLRAHVDLVVLSACRTALGKEVQGEGLIGLTRGFMYAGASSVVASLWKVDDEATSELMKRFYGNMLQHGMTPAEALRAAQNDIRQEPQWRSPYYWAAFTLQGEYRHVIKPVPAAANSTYLKLTVGGILLALAACAAWLYRGRRRRGRASSVQETV